MRYLRFELPEFASFIFGTLDHISIYNGPEFDPWCRHQYPIDRMATSVELRIDWERYGDSDHNTQYRELFQYAHEATFSYSKVSPKLEELLNSITGGTGYRSYIMIDNDLEVCQNFYIAGLGIIFDDPAHALLFKLSFQFP